MVVVERLWCEVTRTHRFLNVLTSRFRRVVGRDDLRIDSGYLALRGRICRSGTKQTKVEGPRHHWVVCRSMVHLLRHLYMDHRGRMMLKGEVDPCCPVDRPMAALVRTAARSAVEGPAVRQARTKGQEAIVTSCADGNVHYVAADH